MKPPLMLPSYLCGECGIEMLMTNEPTQERAVRKAAVLSCYTPRCPQKGMTLTVDLMTSRVASEDSIAT